MRNSYAIAGLLTGLLTVYICLFGIYSRTMIILLLWSSIIAFALYGYDKLSAVQRWRRVPEKTLLALSVLGAMPGALLAQGIFNHKVSKKPFQIKFWLCNLLSLAVLSGLYLSEN